MLRMEQSLIYVQGLVIRSFRHLLPDPCQRPKRANRGPGHMPQYDKICLGFQVGFLPPQIRANAPDAHIVILGLPEGVLSALRGSAAAALYRDSLARAVADLQAGGFQRLTLLQLPEAQVCPAPCCCRPCSKSCAHAPAGTCARPSSCDLVVVVPLVVGCPCAAGKQKCTQP